MTLVLFDMFLGDSPVSPSPKASVVDGLAKVHKLLPDILINSSTFSFNATYYSVLRLADFSLQLT